MTQTQETRFPRVIEDEETVSVTSTKVKSTRKNLYKVRLDGKPPEGCKGSKSGSLAEVKINDHSRGKFNREEIGHGNLQDNSEIKSEAEDCTRF